MATTSPDSIFSPSGGQQWNLTSDWRQTAESVQTALNRVRDEITPGAHLFTGTSSERISFSSQAEDGVVWQDTDNEWFRYVRQNGTWVRASGTKLLATSAGIFLDGGQTITLSEPISAQPNGIIIVWSRYTSGSGAENIYWNYQYIPKLSAMSGLGGSHVFQTTASTNGSLIGYKVVYIDSDTQLSGLSTNQDSPNNRMVLRYVYGY